MRIANTTGVIKWTLFFFQWTIQYLRWQTLLRVCIYQCVIIPKWSRPPPIGMVAAPHLLTSSFALVEKLFFTFTSFLVHKHIFSMPTTSYLYQVRLWSRTIFVQYKVKRQNVCPRKIKEIEHTRIRSFIPLHLYLLIKKETLLPVRHIFLPKTPCSCLKSTCGPVLSESGKMFCFYRKAPDLSVNQPAVLC